MGLQLVTYNYTTQRNQNDLGLDNNNDDNNHYNKNKRNMIIIIICSPYLLRLVICVYC